MKDQLKNSSRIGLVFGAVTIFFILIGLTVTTSEIIGNTLGLDTHTRVGNATGLIVFYGLLGLWSGSKAAKGANKKWQMALLAGGLANLVYAVLISLSVYLVGSLDAADIEMRTYFVQLSRPNVRLLLYGRNPLAGVLITLITILVAGILGGLLAYLSKENQTNQKIAGRFQDWANQLKDTLIAKRYQEDKRVRTIIYILLFALLLALPLVLDKYWNYALGTVGIYVMMGLGLNIVVGLAGLLDLGYVAPFAIGAYGVGLLTAPKPLPIQMGFWPALLISIVLAAVVRILLGLPVLRMRGDYLAIVTLGFGEIIRILIRSDMMSPYLGGPQGVRDIAGPTIFGVPFNSEQAFMYLIILGIILTIILTINLQNSRVGRAWMAMREDETVAQAMGINTLYYKLMAFATGATFAGLGGALFASRNQYTGPADHTLMVSINVLCLLIVGGMGSIPGVIAGAFALKGLPEILRELDLYRLLVFGALLVIMMIWRPEGLWPAPRRRLELREKNTTDIPSDEQMTTAEEE